MIVAFDAGPAKERPSGVGVYVRELGRSLVRTPDGLDLRIVGARADGPLIGLAATTMRGRLHQAWVQLHANSDVLTVGAELVHFTNAVAPLRSARPFVLTIQDLSLIRYPHYHPKLRLAAIPIMAWAARRARYVIVPSNSTADEVVKYLRVAPERIVVTELAPAPPVADDFGASAGDPLDRLGLAGVPFLASLATIEPRKNTPRLIAAFEQLSLDQPELRLVLIGSVGWRTGSIMRRISDSPVADRIVLTGYVSDSERATLLRECAAFAYVSLYEGYGLPIVEAMAQGAPVVTSNLSSMPEAAGGAAVLVDPLDPAAIAHGLREAMSDREAMADAGRRRAAVLGWDRTAHETRAVYERALSRWV